MRFLRATYLLIIVIVSLWFAPDVSAAPPKGWETVKTERSDAKPVARDSEIEIKVAGSSILVTTNHTVAIKVVTILGRTISSETLQPGTWQLSLPAHGVYIVKVGDITCKIAL